MKNKFLDADQALDHLTKTQERELIRVYQSSLKNIRGQIALAYEKYDGSWAEMQKYQRLATLEKGISKEIAKLTSKNALTLKSGLAQSFAESYYRTAFILEGQVQAKLGFGQLNPKVIEAAITNPLDRIGFLQRNRDNQARLTRQLREQLAQGLIQGDSYQQTARRIKERMDIGATNTMRIVQTENHRAQQMGRAEALEDAADYGVEMKKMWIATLDADTRDSHQELDGKTIGLDDDFEGHYGSGPIPGQLGDPRDDINCRCSHIGVIEGYEPKVRRAREVEGQRGEIIQYKTYKQWEAGRL